MTSSTGRATSIGAVLRFVGLATASLLGAALLTVAASRAGSAGPVLLLAVPLVAVLATAAVSYPLVGLLLVFATFPVGIVDIPLPGFPVKLQQLVVLLAVLVVAVGRMAARRWPLVWDRTLNPGLVLSALVLMEVSLSLDSGLALKQAAAIVIGLLAAVTATSACSSLLDVRRAVYGLVTVGAGMCGYAIATAGTLQSSYGGGIVENRAQGIFQGGPNELGIFAAALLVISLGALIGAPSSRARSWLAAAVGIDLIALLLSLSRGGWIGAVFGVFALTVLLPKARRVLGLSLVPIVLAAFAVGSVGTNSPQVKVVAERLGTAVDPNANPYDNRPKIWREALREVRAKPVFGQGPGNFPIASHRDDAVTQTVVEANHGHNVLLTVAAETGLSGLAVVLWFTLLVGLTARQQVARLHGSPDAAVVAGLAAGLFVFVGEGLVDYPMRNTIMSTLVWSSVGLLAAVRRHSASGSTP